MSRCAFLSCENLEGFVFDDELAIPHFKELGWEVSTEDWRSDCDWSQYDMVIIRTTWNYTQHLDEFLQRLELINKSTLLLNPLELIQWNARKTYIKDLQAWGVPCIPTLFSAPTNWEKCFDEWQTQRIMLKPQVGANADGTTIISKNNIPQKAQLETPVMIQPFRESIISEGEFSFHFFSSQFSHCILKVPKESDYRVQEEHGGNILPVSASPGDLMAACSIQKILDQNLCPSTYSRIDLVRSPDGQLELMEAELIEPALYFRTNAQAAQSFAQACVAKAKNI